MDLAFWYLHADFSQLAALATPTLVAVFGMAVVLVSITQTWDLPGVLLYVLYAIVVPTIVLWLAVFLPLPSAVFAWRRRPARCRKPANVFNFVCAAWAG